MFHSQQKTWALSVGIVISTLFYFTLTTCSAAMIIGGTGNALGTMKWLAEAYQKVNPEVAITVLPSIGSSGAIKSVPTGRIQIGLSARPLKKAELEKGIIAIEYARTPTIFAVSNKTNAAGLTHQQLVDIYTGVLRKWPDGSTIRPILRQAKDDNTKQIKALSPEMKKAVELAENKKEFLFAATDQETVEIIEKTPGSFGVTSLALMLSEKRDLHPLTLDGINPTVASSISGEYPMLKKFYFILPKKQSAQVKAFLDFVFSEAGSAILKQYGCSPVQ